MHDTSLTFQWFWVEKLHHPYFIPFQKEGMSCSDLHILGILLIWTDNICTYNQGHLQEAFEAQAKSHFLTHLPISVSIQVESSDNEHYGGGGQGEEKINHNHGLVIDPLWTLDSFLTSEKPGTDDSEGPFHLGHLITDS